MNVLLFIGESLGWQELLLVGVVALIVLGPRKLPQLAKTIGKTMAEFRKVTNEFKSTWEKEVEEDKGLLQTFISDPVTSDTATVNTISAPEVNLLTPQVKELSAAEIATMFPGTKLETADETTIEASPIETTVESAKEVEPLSKKDWL